jgi:aminodeoxyfutalosine synthase
MDAFITQAGLGHILDKVRAGERLSLDDGRRLYEHPDILALGYLANIVRERQNGNRAYFIYNQHINYSNVCTNLCKFCAFGRPKGDALAYEMSLDDIRAKVRDRLDEPISEIHIVGGIHPDLPFAYYVDMLRAIREIRPDVHLQAFTCVEIHHLAKLAGKPVDETLRLLMDAGLGSMPGGGAEVFNPRIRQLTCPDKLPGEGCAPTPPCSTVTSRPSTSGSSIWTPCAAARTKPAASSPSSRSPTTRRTPSWAGRATPPGSTT